MVRISKTRGDQIMKAFKVEITETLQRQYEVLADSLDEAKEFIQDQYQNEEIILDESDYVDTDWKAEEIDATGLNVNNTLSTNAVYERNI